MLSVAAGRGLGRRPPSPSALGVVGFLGSARRLRAAYVPPTCLLLFATCRYVPTTKSSEPRDF